jgi:hypothetical protein
MFITHVLVIGFLAWASVTQCKAVSFISKSISNLYLFVLTSITLFQLPRSHYNRVYLRRRSLQQHKEKHV